MFSQGNLSGLVASTCYVYISLDLEANFNISIIYMTDAIVS